MGNKTDTFSQPSPCDAVLVPSVTIVTERRDVRLAIFKLVTQDNYAQSKKAYAATVPGYFDGSYDEFAAKRDKFYQQESTDLSISEARNVLISVVPEYAVQAWKDCMSKQVGQLQAWVTVADEKSAIVRVRWIAGGGFGKLSKTEVVVDGGAKVYGDEFSPNDAFDGEASFHVTRPAAYEAVMGTVSGMSNGASFTCEFTVPRMLRLVQKPISQVMNFGDRNIGNYQTEAYPGRAKLKLTGAATVHWEPRNDGQHWVHCVLRRDGGVFDYTGEVGVPEGQQQTATTKTLELDVPPGVRYAIQVDTDNAGAKSESLTLRIEGWYETYE